MPQLERLKGIWDTMSHPYVGFWLRIMWPRPKRGENTLENLLFWVNRIALNWLSSHLLQKWGSKFFNPNNTAKLKDLGLESYRPSKKSLLMAEIRRTRLEWCKEYESWTALVWEQVIFSDDSIINMMGADGGFSVRRILGEAFANIKVWAAITKFYF